MSERIPTEVRNVVTEFSALVRGREVEVQEACRRYLDAEAKCLQALKAVPVPDRPGRPGRKPSKDATAEEKDRYAKAKAEYSLWKADPVHYASLRRADAIRAAKAAVRDESEAVTADRETARLVCCAGHVAAQSDPEIANAEGLFDWQPEIGEHERVKQVLWALLVDAENWPVEVRRLEAALAAVKRRWGPAESTPPVHHEADGDRPAALAREAPACLGAPRRKNLAWVKRAEVLLFEELQKPVTGDAVYVRDAALARAVGVSHTTVTRYLQKHGSDAKNMLVRLYGTYKTAGCGEQPDSKPYDDSF